MYTQEQWEDAFVNRRRGYIRVSDYVIYKEPYVAVFLQQHLFVEHVEHDVYREMLTYSCLSPAFDPVDKGEMAKYYDVIVTNTDEGISLELEKSKHTTPSLFKMFTGQV